MSWLEENIGEGYQQVVIGFSVFIIGALLGWMEAADNVMSASDVYMPAVIMLSGAMVTMLGLSFGTENEEDRTDDLMNAFYSLVREYVDAAIEVNWTNHLKTQERQYRPIRPASIRVTEPHRGCPRYRLGSIQRHPLTSEYLGDIPSCRLEL